MSASFHSFTNGYCTKTLQKRVAGLIAFIIMSTVIATGILFDGCFTHPSRCLTKNQLRDAIPIIALAGLIVILLLALLVYLIHRGHLHPTCPCPYERRYNIVFVLPAVDLQIDYLR